MYKYLTIILVTTALVISSCKKSNSQMSDVETWKMGWRLIENSMDDNFKLAELQFDSLLQNTQKLELKFLKVGLEVKSKLSKEKEILEIIKAQDENTLRELCSKHFLKDLTPCSSIPQENVTHPELQLELVKMFINDQYVRSNLMTDLIEKYDLTKEEVIIDSLGMETDTNNRANLKSIFQEIGFPTKKQVGEDGMDAIFYIIQHADGDKSWQKSQLAHIEAAVKKGDLDGQNYAYLYDRIQVNSGKKQKYGTQFSKVDPINKIVELAETENLESLDERRREIGMMPIDMYKRMMLKNI